MFYTRENNPGFAYISQTRTWNFYLLLTILYLYTYHHTNTNNTEIVSGVHTKDTHGKYYFHPIIYQCFLLSLFCLLPILLLHNNGLNVCTPINLDVLM